MLEERRLLAADHWTSAASGSWHDAKDASTGAVPQAADPMVIDAAGAYPTIRTSTTKGVHAYYLSSEHLLKIRR